MNWFNREYKRLNLFWFFYRNGRLFSFFVFLNVRLNWFVSLSGQYWFGLLASAGDIFGSFAWMDNWSPIGVGGYGPWERNHPSLFDDRVDPENFNLESHNIVPRLQSAIAKTGFPSRLVLFLARFARSQQLALCVSARKRSRTPQCCLKYSRNI